MTEQRETATTTTMPFNEEPRLRHAEPMRCTAGFNKTPCPACRAVLSESHEAILALAEASDELKAEALHWLADEDPMSVLHALEAVRPRLHQHRIKLNQPPHEVTVEQVVIGSAVWIAPLGTPLGLPAESDMRLLGWRRIE
jgi:hypothetical protein